ncbi:MAG: TIGR00730 family Rossman fold protein [Rubrivivax sp.]|nr:TIGR00730 family Rossman fold protein [Rubrivivax sp.]MBK8526586.1 TIGR00730 family Rossman fold protein [Rubrivivax sp.]
MSGTSFGLCVFCGSRSGTDPAHASAARDIGRGLAARGWQLVYGGGRVGLMGVVADAAKQGGARVTGVIPESLMRREVGHQGLDELLVVPSMHVRKQQMAERADAFVALPGGLGTLEELFEVWTWRQLGYHDRPIALLNTGGYYDLLLDFLLHSTAQQFVSQAQTDLLIVERDPAVLLERIAEALPAARTGQAPDLSRS